MCQIKFKNNQIQKFKNNQKFNNNHIRLQFEQIKISSIFHLRCWMTGRRGVDISVARVASFKFEIIINFFIALTWIERLLCVHQNVWQRLFAADILCLCSQQMFCCSCNKVVCVCFVDSVRSVLLLIIKLIHV